MIDSWGEWRKYGEIAAGREAPARARPPLAPHHTRVPAKIHATGAAQAQHRSSTVEGFLMHKFS